MRYTTGQPARSGQPVSNTFGLTGEGMLTFDADTLVFEGKRSGVLDSLRAAPRIRLADVANVDYNAASSAFLIRTHNGKHYVIIWAASHEDAEAIWALLPQEKTPEFVEDQAAHERFGKVMSMLGKRAYVTPSIIAINVAVFLIMLAAGADLMNPNPAIHIRFGSNFGPLTWTGEEWRLLTSAFLHFGLLHIALNMFALYQAGGLVERLFGSTRFALIYLLSALSGSVASGWWDPLRNSAGASGAIFGVYGALLAFMAVRRADIPPSMLKSIRQQRAGVLPVFAGDRCRASADRQRLPCRRVVRRVDRGRDPGTPVQHRSACGAPTREIAHRNAGHWIATDVDGALAGRRRWPPCRQPAIQS